MPKIYTVPQGEPEWYRLRMAIPTSSEFKRIVTPKGSLSAQSREYMHHLLAEFMLDRPILGEVETFWMHRGRDLEDEAARTYEFLRSVEGQRIGFMTTDDGLIGSSPDMLVGEDTVVEIKCPKPTTHAGYMLHRELQAEKKPQVQGQLMVSEREHCDVLSYCPGMPTVIIRMERDEVYIKALREALGEFVERLQFAKHELTERYGPFTQLLPGEERSHDKDYISPEDVDEILARHGIAQ